MSVVIIYQDCEIVLSNFFYNSPNNVYASYMNSIKKHMKVFSYVSDIALILLNFQFHCNRCIVTANYSLFQNHAVVILQ